MYSFYSEPNNKNYVDQLFLQNKLKIPFQCLYTRGLMTFHNVSQALS